MKKSLILSVLFAFVLSFGVLTAFPSHALAAKSGIAKDAKAAGSKSGKSPKSVNHAKSSKGGKHAKASKNGKSKHAKSKKHAKKHSTK